MAGLGRSIDIFNEKMLERVRPTIHGANDAVVTIYDPELKDIDVDYDTGAVTSTRGDIIADEVPARIMPVRGANLREGDPIQRIRVAVPVSAFDGEPRPGLTVYVESAPLYPWLETWHMTVIEVVQSSAPITVTLECMQNTQQGGQE